MPAPTLTESPFARRQVAAAARRASPRGCDRDDAAQAILLRLLRAAPAFDPAKGTPEAFATTVVARAAADLRRRRRTAGPYRPLDRLADEPAYDPYPAVDRALDVAAVLARLPADLRAVAELLKAGTVAGAAREQATSRGALRRSVRALRAAFERYKLRDS